MSAADCHAAARPQMKTAAQGAVNLERPLEVEVARWMALDETAK